MASLPTNRLVAWRSFLEAHAAVLQVLEAELQEGVDLSLVWYDVLVQLAEAPDRRLRMRELADAVLLSKSGLTRLVQRLEAEGLVDREACDDDRRGTWAVLSDAGLQRLRDAAPTHLDGVARHFTDLLEDDEVEVLSKALSRIAEANRPALGEG